MLSVKSQLSKTRSFLEKNYKIFVALIFVMHLAGLIGLSITTSKYWFELLTPFNLITSITLLLLFHKDYSYSFWSFVFLTFVIGFGSEVIGVHTGAIFGNYEYGQTLGWKLWEVPLLIGCNWIVLIYIINHTVQKYITKKRFLGAVWSAIGMVLLDLLIEQVAIRHDFWSWESYSIPLQNYIGWFLVALPLCLLYQYSSFKKENVLATPLLLAQILFFGGYVLILFLF